MSAEAGVRRREFLRVSATAGAGLLATADFVHGAPAGAVGGAEDLAQLPALSAALAARDESFWRQVRAMYNPDPSLLDFDHGNSGAAPTRVIEAYMRRARLLNRAPNIYYPRFGSGDAFFERLAGWLGAKPDDIAMLPNATTGLNTVLRGFPLQRGDEVLVSSHEYPDMVETLHRRAAREGIVVRTAVVPGLDATPQAVVDSIAAGITAATKLLLISHVSAWNGEVLPVAAISAMARTRGVAVLVDAAQSMGYLPIDFAGWGCDFLAASFHKGTGAPIGTGVLLLRPEWVGKVEPMHPPTWDFSKYPIDQYSWIGTTNVAAGATIAEAIETQTHIGLARKRARLEYLADYWQSRARGIKGFRVLTPAHPERHMGFASFAVDHVPSKALAERMRKEFKIEVQDKASRPYRPFDNAVRVTPQPYTSLAELDRFVRALRVIAQG